MQAQYRIGTRSAQQGTSERRPLMVRRPSVLVDPFLVAGSVLAAIVGLVMVYTATRGPLLLAGTSPTYFVKRQAVFVVLGIVVMGLVGLFDYRKLEPLGMAVYGLSVFVLLAVMVPHIGTHSPLGSARWFNLGPIQIQPSEFAVLGLVVAVATYCARRPDGLTWRDVIKVLALGAVPIALVMAQPDLGTGIIMSVVLLVMLSVAGLPTRVLIALLVGAAGVVALVLAAGILHHYQILRITSFLHQSTAHPTGTLADAVYNLQQSKDAIGAGGLFGTGIGHGAATNLGYVPEQQTDFIFTAVGEQLGFVGSVGVLALLFFLAWRVLRVGQLARDDFGRLVCAGVFTFLAFSTFQNAGMTIGIMPITGIPLPFISYGGTAVIAFFTGVGLALSVYARRGG
ncbi:MAG: FtsW/RodA/SpoVE family cell cycle protein [Actinomycetota bacterium]|jgi:rod shape determining protein RodA|nr:FtsW/RodA/SpoVE family cell cycle protein [Actinomycetota bacterium]